MSQTPPQLDPEAVILKETHVFSSVDEMHTDRCSLAQGRDLGPRKTLGLYCLKSSSNLIHAKLFAVNLQKIPSRPFLDSFFLHRLVQGPDAPSYTTGELPPVRLTPMERPAVLGPMGFLRYTESASPLLLGES